MIRSMTAFANARTEFEFGTLSIDIRSVNNRFLDLHLRLPEELRFSEAAIREQLTQTLQRGKVEIRVQFQRAFNAEQNQLHPELLAQLAAQLQAARNIIPDIPAPRLSEVIALHHQEQGLDHEVWLPIILRCLESALHDFQAAKVREGQRLAEAMQQLAEQMSEHVQVVEQHLPDILREQQQKIADRLHEALTGVSPDGFAQISGEELSARVAQESALFGLRVDVEEELTRLRSHIQELHIILKSQPTPAASTNKTRRGSIGKRLDFLFQEMNREANTLGSKAGSIEVTRAAIELKLLIEQLREQAQNIE